jgi:hypothetical protein
MARYFLCLFGLIGILTALAGHALAVESSRFVVMQFNDLGPGGQASNYNACSDARLSKANILGLVSAQRFTLNDVQMFPGASVEMPKYLTLAEINASDSKTAFDNFAAGVAAMGAVCPGADVTKTLSYTYRIVLHTAAPAKSGANLAPEGTSKQDYVHIVFTVPNDEPSTEFEYWYASCHIPEILERVGLVSGDRGIDGGGTGPIPPTRTMALYRIALPDNLTIAATRPGPRPPSARDCQVGKMMNRQLSRGYSYKAIGAPVQPRS